MIRLLFLLLLPSVALAQFGAFERDFIIARSNLTVSGGITLGGVLRTNWPSLAGALTPWSSDIDGGGFNLSNVGTGSFAVINLGDGDLSEMLAGKVATSAVVIVGSTTNNFNGTGWNLGSIASTGTNTLAEVLAAGNNAGGLSITSVGSVGGSPGADLSLTAADGGEDDEPNPSSVVIGAGGGNALDGSVTVKAGQLTPWSAYLTLGARTNFTFGGHVVLQAGSDATSLLGAKLKLYGAGSGTGQIELTAADGVAADIVLTPGVAGDATGAVNIARGQLKLGDTTLQKSSTSNITVNFPGNSGTLALTADLAGYLATGSVSYVDSLGVTNPVTTGTVIVGGDANALTGLVAGANISISGTGRTRTIAAPNVITTSGGTITGNLTINGTRTEDTTIYQQTTINLGTNYTATTIYSTQEISQTTIVYTNVVTTNTVNTYVNNGGSFTVGNGGELIATSATVRLPHLTCTPGGSAVATGTWDFSGATVSGLGTSSITTGDVQGIISAYGAVTNSGSNVSGLTLTTSGGIVTLGGSIPPSGDALTTNQVNGLIASGITGKAETNITTTEPSGTGSLIYSNSQFYFTPPSAAGIGSVTNVYITFNAGEGITVNGGASVVATNNSTLTIAATIPALYDSTNINLSFPFVSSTNLQTIVTNVTLPSAFVRRAFVGMNTTNAISTTLNLGWYVGTTNAGSVIRRDFLIPISVSAIESNTAPGAAALYSTIGNSIVDRSLVEITDTSHTETTTVTFATSSAGATQVYDSPESSLGSATVFNGALYFGSNPNGKVYKTTDGSTFSEAYDSPESYLPSAAVFNGALYFGSGSNGKVYKTTDGSTFSEVYDSPEGALQSAAVFNGALYFGSGINGKVYKTTDGSTFSEVYDSPESYFYSAAVFNGALYFGSNPNGKVYKTTDGSTFSEVYDSPETTLYGAAVFNGALYFGSGSNGKVYKTTDGSTFSEVYDSPESYFYSAAVFNGALYFGSGINGKIYKTTDGSTFSEAYDSPETTLYNAAVFNGALYFGSGPNGAVYRYSATGQMTISPPLTYGYTNGVVRLLYPVCPPILHTNTALRIDLLSSGTNTVHISLESLK